MFLLGGARLFEEPREKLTGADLLDLEETRQSREKAMIIYIYIWYMYIYIYISHSLIPWFQWMMTVTLQADIHLQNSALLVDRLLQFIVIGHTQTLF